MKALMKIISAAGTEELSIFTIIAIKLKDTEEMNIMTGPFALISGMIYIFREAFHYGFHFHPAGAFDEYRVVRPDRSFNILTASAFDMAA